jgi:hypothetical protein
MRVSDIEQLVNFHSTLNPDIWQNGRMRPEVRLALFRIAKEFVNFIAVKDLRLTDITVSGSNAAYNYNKDSDIDLHLIANSEGPCKEDLQELFLSKKSLFNDQYDIMIGGHAVEVYVQDEDGPHISNGIYSVYNDSWIKKPKHTNERPDVTNIEDKFEFFNSQIEQAIESKDSETISKLKARIKKMRQSGLEKGGEFGVENLTFKLLRNTGAMDRLWNAGKEADDNRLSLDK